MENKKNEPNGYGSTLVSIGVPVFNGSKHIERALTSLIDQSHKNIEIIISDNASTDDTLDLCKKFMNNDSRIKYIRQEKNIGAFGNFNCVLKQAKGDFFMFAAHDDKWEREFVRENLIVLLNNDEAVSSCSRAIFIEDNIDKYEAEGTFEINGNKLHRIKKYLNKPSDNTRYYGIFRRSAMVNAYDACKGFQLIGLDWLHMMLTLKEGSHLEVNQVLLRREVAKFDKYYNATKYYNKNYISLFFPICPVSLKMLQYLTLIEKIFLVPNLLLLNFRMLKHQLKIMYKTTVK